MTEVNELFGPNGPCGNQYPPGDFPDRLVADEYLFIVFFLKVASDIYHNDIIKLRTAK
jgi:hypothetical protein